MDYKRYFRINPECAGNILTKQPPRSIFINQGYMYIYRQKMFNNQYLSATNGFAKTTEVRLKFKNAFLHRRSNTQTAAQSQNREGEQTGRNSSRYSVRIIKPRDYDQLAKTVKLRATSWVKPSLIKQEASNCVPNFGQNRSMVQMPANYSSMQGFLPFVQINTQQKQRIIKELRRLEQGQPGPIQVSPRKRINSTLNIVKAEIAYNKMQIGNIKDFQKREFAKTLGDFKAIHQKIARQELIFNAKVKKKSTLPKNRELKYDRIGLLLNHKLFQSNKIVAKPQLSDDSWVVYSRSNDIVYYIGGRHPLNQVPSYSLKTLTWAVKPKHISVIDFVSTSWAKLPTSNKILIFGGQVPVAQAKIKTLHNKVYELDLDSMEMTKVNVENSQIVLNRRCHQICVTHKYVVQFGGIDRNYKFLKDLNILSTRRWKWSSLDYECSERVNKYLQKGLAKFSMLADPEIYSIQYLVGQFDSNTPESTSEETDKKCVFVFGGLDQQGTALNKLLLIKFRLGDGGPTIEEAKTFGMQPSPRYDHAMCFLKNFLIIHGGRNSEKQSASQMILRDIHALNRDNWSWSLVDVDEKVDRAEHLLFGRGESLWIFGGRDSYGITKAVVEYAFVGENKQDDLVVKNISNKKSS